MKKILNNIKNKANTAVCTAKAVLADKKAENYVDSGVKILIAVVIGALLLAGLYELFDDVIVPTAAGRVMTLFNYHG